MTCPTNHALAVYRTPQWLFSGSQQGTSRNQTRKGPEGTVVVNSDTRSEGRVNAPAARDPNNGIFRNQTKKGPRPGFVRLSEGNEASFFSPGLRVCSPGGQA